MLCFFAGREDSVLFPAAHDGERVLTSYSKVDKNIRHLKVGCSYEINCLNIFTNNIQIEN